MRLSTTQKALLSHLKLHRGNWLSAGDISKTMRKQREFSHLRAGAIAGPMTSLANRGLVEREQRERKTPMRMHGGRIVFPRYYVYRATDAAFEFELEGEQKELPI